MDDFYQVELSANQVFTRDLNSSVNGIVPVPLGYKMCLNGSNNTGNISNLPDFNATIKLNNNTGRLRSDIGLFRFSPFMNLGDSFDVLAKDPWNDTIDNHGNYTFSALVDNQQLNINLTAERTNTSLSLIATNITYGDNTNITATLTSSNGTLLTNKNLTFNINGTDYNVTTNELGVAVLNIGGLHAGVYNVSASFNGDADYNPSTNNTIFNVGKRNTSLSIVKTVDSTVPVVVGDLVVYTIKVMNNGISNISTPILVNDTLVSGFEYVGSSDSVIA
ncbi:MAG: Pseudogene of Ig-like domain repeat protein [Methanobrevibacter sp. CfCl-M3]